MSDRLIMLGVAIVATVAIALGALVMLDTWRAVRDGERPSELFFGFMAVAIVAGLLIRIGGLLASQEVQP